jgi:hypothetical protein
MKPNLLLSIETVYSSPQKILKGGCKREKKQALKKLTRQIDKKGNCGKDRRCKS